MTNYAQSAVFTLRAVDKTKPDSDMVGLVNLEGGRWKYVNGSWTVNPANGLRYLSLVIEDEGDDIAFVGKLFAYTTEKGKTLYGGELTRPAPQLDEDFFFDLFNHTVLGFSLEDSVGEHGEVGMKGLVYHPHKAETFSLDRELWESDRPF